MTRNPDLELLAGFLAAGVLSHVVRPGGPRRALRVGDREIPSACLVRAATGHRCPSCGLTRGMVYMFRGEPLNSFRAHPGAPALFVWVAFMAALSALNLIGRTLGLGRRAPDRSG